MPSKCLHPPTHCYDETKKRNKETVDKQKYFFSFSEIILTWLDKK